MKHLDYEVSLQLPAKPACEMMLLLFSLFGGSSCLQDNDRVKLDWIKDCKRGDVVREELRFHITADITNIGILLRDIYELLHSLGAQIPDICINTIEVEDDSQPAYT